jgi:hypothetical protein
VSLFMPHDYLQRARKGKRALRRLFDESTTCPA